MKALVTLALAPAPGGDLTHGRHRGARGMNTLVTLALAPAPGDHLTHDHDTAEHEA